MKVVLFDVWGIFCCLENEQIVFFGILTSHRAHTAKCLIIPDYIIYE